MRDRLSLETLKIHGLGIYRSQNGKVGRVPKDREEWTFEGTDQIREGLDEVIRRIEEMESSDD